MRTPPLQINWVADELYAAGLGLGVPTNLLVFGLGLDSALWQSINCLGRTVFLENYPGVWVGRVVHRGGLQKSC